MMYLLRSEDGKCFAGEERVDGVIKAILSDSKDGAYMFYDGQESEAWIIAYKLAWKGYGQFFLYVEKR